METTLLEDKFNWLVKFICNKHEIDRNMLLSRSRSREFVVLRQIIMKILYDYKKHYIFSLAKIGKLFISDINKTGYDHATVLHAKKTIDNLIETDKDFTVKFNFILDSYKTFFSLNSLEGQIFNDPLQCDKKSIIYSLTGVYYVF
jgi:chromosomal replication initiator protein